MKLEPTSELMSAYLDGELTADEQILVEQSIRDDPEVRRAHDELRALRATLQSMPRCEPEQDLTERIMRQAERTMLTGGAPKGPNSLGKNPRSTEGLAAIGPVAPSHAAPWRNWSVTLSVIGTLAALLLIALWLPNTLDPLEMARHEAVSDLESSQPASEGDLVRDDGGAGMGMAEDLKLGDPEAYGPEDESLRTQTEGMGGLAARRDGNAARGGEVSEGESEKAELAKTTSRFEAPAQSKYGDAQRKGVGGESGDARYSRSAEMPNGAPARPSATTPQLQQVFDAMPELPTRGLESTSLAFERDAVELRTADAKRLIDQLDTPQILCVQVEFTGTEAPLGNRGAAAWLGSKLQRGGDDDISRQAVRFVESRDVPEELNGSGDEVVLAEGSADQIRAAIANLAKLDGVELKLAASSNQQWLKADNSDRLLAYPSGPDASRPAIDADRSDTGKYSDPFPNADNAAERVVDSRMTTEENSGGTRRDDKLKRRLRTDSSPADASMQGMPGAAGGLAGGADSGVRPPAAGQPPAAGKSAGRRERALGEEEMMGQSAEPQESLKEPAKEEVAAKNSSHDGQPVPSDFGAKDGGGPSRTRKGKGVGDGAAGLADIVDRGQEPSLYQQSGSAGGTATPSTLRAPVEAAVGISAGEMVSKPRRVRILFRVTPITGASPARPAAPAAAGTQGTQQDTEK